MDAMRALATGEGCTADGTAATRNPLSQFMNSAMGGMEAGKNAQRMPQQGFQGAGPQGQQMDAIDRGMAAGMGLRQMPRGAPQMNAQGSAFVHEFEQRRAAGIPPGAAMMGPGPMARGPMHAGGEAWVHDFQNMNMGPQPGMQHRMEAAYQDSFRHPRQMADRWANKMAARGPMPMRPMDQAWQGAAKPNRVENWTKEMNTAKAAPQAKSEEWAKEMVKEEEAAAQLAPDMEATRQATDDMVDLLGSNPKFKDSKFFDFMSKVSSGELAFQDNKVVSTGVEHAAASMDQAWKQATPETQQQTVPPMDAPAATMDEMFQSAWNESLNGKDVDFGDVWKKAMAATGENGGLSEEMFEQAFKAQQADFEKAWEAPNAGLNTPYELTANNPYLQQENPYEMGLQLFRDGQLNEAIMAFEAAVEKEPSHADAWRMLGVTHQENDEDRKAIACLERAVDQDPYHLDALLGLGVSYVNELDQERALKNLKAWIMNNPNFQGLEVTQDAYSDGSLMDDVTQLMLKASEWAPQDADVQEVLGVLYNVSRDYESAVQAFRSALRQKPDEYSLWNKLGATLANGSKSEDAIPSYHRALELKPKYARGWLNLGISHSNLGGYEEAARCYLKALDLNPNATHIWSYLRICFTCMERFDLIALADGKDLEAFRAEFQF